MNEIINWLKEYREFGILAGIFLYYIYQTQGVRISLTRKNKNDDQAVNTVQAALNSIDHKCGDHKILEDYVRESRAFNADVVRYMIWNSRHIHKICAHLNIPIDPEPKEKTA